MYWQHKSCSEGIECLVVSQGGSYLEEVNKINFVFSLKGGKFCVLLLQQTRQNLNIFKMMVLVTQDRPHLISHDLEQAGLDSAGRIIACWPPWSSKNIWRKISTCLFGWGWVNCWITKAEVEGKKPHTFACFSKTLPCCQINYITLVGVVKSTWDRRSC